MAHIEEKSIYGVGMVKEIEESAISLVLQNLQQDQYQYPIKSFIREIASNAVDSIEEKKTALAILRGELAVEDCYAESTSELTKDSTFDISYYDPKYLSNEDEITIRYIQRDRDKTNRDQIIITDSGVGLGGERLKGFFRPAFSTKRLNKKALGKWGVGSKSGLATGVESYRVISIYNGRRYTFDIFPDRFMSVTPRFSECGEVNPHEVWTAKSYTEDDKIAEIDNFIYYEPTLETNGVSIIMDVKNPAINKAKFIDAVKSQLTYFDYVRLFMEFESSPSMNSEVFFKTEILYRDEYMIIPKDNYYSVPHLVLNGVSYGTIDFAEAEMDEKRGNIAIIGDPSEIDVSQSRETVRYTERTREALKKYLGNAVLVAQRSVQGELDANKHDLLKWFISCSNIRAKNSRDDIFSRLAGLADLNSIEFKHPLGYSFNSQNFNRVFFGYKVTRTEVYGGLGNLSVNTYDVNSWESFSPKNLYLADIEFSKIQMTYIAKTNNVTTVYRIWPTGEALSNDLIGEFKKSDVFHSLSTVVVPEEFVTQYMDAQAAVDIKKEKEARELAMSEAELRKYNNEILIHTLNIPQGAVANSWNTFPKFTATDITRSRLSLSVERIKDVFTKENTIFGLVSDMPLLQSLIHTYNGWSTKFGDSSTFTSFRNDRRNSLQLIVISKEAVKYVSNYATYVKDALTNLQGKHLTIMEVLKKYNTTRQFRDMFSKYQENFGFIKYFEFIDIDAYNAYMTLKDYYNSGFGSNAVTDRSGLSDHVISYMDKLTEFELFTHRELDKTKIAEKALEFFGNSEIESCSSVDLNIYSMYLALCDYTENLKDMLYPFSSYNLGLKSDSVVAILDYIRYKEIPNFSEFLKARREEFHLENN